MNIDGDVYRCVGKPGWVGVASMEPSMNIDGDDRARHPDVPRRAASMEPSMNIDGDRPRRTPSRASCSCFNGAVDEHRRRQEAVGKAQAGTAASMEPSMNIDGDLSAGGGGRDRRDASMEPSMNIDGDLVVITNCRRSP